MGHPPHPPCNRFKDLAADQSLWKGKVTFEGDRPKLKEEINKFLGSQVDEVEFKSERLGTQASLALPNDYISAKDVSAMLEKCHNMKRLKLRNPYSTSVWTRHDMDCVRKIYKIT